MPQQSPYLAGLPWQLLPIATTIGAAEYLAEIGATED